MWYEKKDNGSVCYRERYTDPVTGLRKTVSVTLSGSTRLDQKKARLLLDRKVSEAQRGRGEVRRLTLAGLVERYVEFKRQTMKLQTAFAARDHFARVLDLLGGNTDPARLTAAYVRNRLWTENAATYNERLKHLKAMLRWAYREDLVEDVSWLDKLTPAKHETVRQRVADRYLEKDELSALLEAMTVTKWRDLSEFLVLSGLRVGEAQALTVRDVNMDERTVTVNKTYSTRIRTISTTKTSASDRTVFIQDELLDLLRRVIGRRRSGILFPSDGGSYFSRDAYMKYVREVSERVLGRRITPHYFRHTHVSLLAASGISLDAIARRVGHESSDITKQIYFHVTEELSEQENEQLKKVVLVGSLVGKKWANGGIERDNLTIFPEMRKA